jgi:hypothetical protein
MRCVKLITHFLLIVCFFVNASVDPNTPIELTFKTILAMEKAENNFPHKDEFETTAEYTKRANSYIENVLDPLTRPMYKISDAVVEKSYDADNNKWTFSLFSPGLETEKILITFHLNEMRAALSKNDNKEHLASVDIKLANTFPLKHSLPMMRDLAKAINESIRAKYTFKLAAPPNRNKTKNKKEYFQFIQTDHYNTLFVDLVELQLYSMGTSLATYSKDSEVIHKIDHQLALKMQTRLIKQKEHISNEIKKYTGLITETIYSNLDTDKYTMEGKKCTLTIRLDPLGAVNNVLATKGDTEVCNAVKKSISKVGTFPVSKEPDIFKEITTIHLTIAPKF